MMKDARVGDPKLRSPAEKPRADPDPDRPFVSPEGFVQEKRPIRVVQQPATPPGSPDDFVQEKRPIRVTRRSMSPRILDVAPERTGRVPEGYQRGASFERTEYERRIYRGDPSVERPEYDRRAYHGRDGSDPVLEGPEYGRRVYHSRDEIGVPRSPSLRQSLRRQDIDEEFLLREEGRLVRERRDKYAMPGYRDPYGERNPNVKYFVGSGSSSSQYSPERHFQGSDRSSLMPPQMVRSAFNSGRGGRTLPASSFGNPKIMHCEDEDIHYQNNLNSDKISAREYYKGEDNRVLYSDDVYDPILVSSHSKDFVSLPSRGSKENYLAYSPENIHSYGNGRRQGRYTSVEGQEGYESPPPDFARDHVLYSDDATFYRYDNAISARDHQEYNYRAHGRREEINPGYRPRLYRHDQPIDGGNYSSRDALRPSLSNSVVEEVEYIERTRKNIRESSSYSQHHLQGKPQSDNRDMVSNPLVADRDVECFGSGNNIFGMKLSSDSERINHGKGFGFGRDAGPLSQKERLKRLHKTECDSNFHKQDASPPRRLKAKEPNIYEETERMVKRRYLTDEELNRRDDRSLELDGRITSRQVRVLNHSEEQWPDENPVGTFSSKRPRFGHLPYQKAGRPDEERIERRISAADDWTSSHDVPRYIQRSTIDSFTTGDGRPSIKGRLRPCSSNDHDSFSMDRRQDFYESNRSGKRYSDNQYNDLFTDDGNHLEDMDTSVKSDLPENSDEFKQHVENLFLQFSKRLNENPSTRRRYLEQGNAGILLCVVCGRLSKQFQDTRSLVTHTFMSRKVGKRAYHLALNKAICVLMGWKSTITPTGACVYEPLPETEAMALKEDLILWHPLVIIHNSLLVGSDSDGSHIVHIEKMEAILRGWGFSGGKIKVRYGKPLNHSILLVRFMPTFPGLQEAERLHQYFLEKNRGRIEFQKLKYNNRNIVSEEPGEILPEEHVEQALYGYLGIAEDLDKLDLDTKKRSLVKSKKDIQAIEDAPLKSE